MQKNEKAAAQKGATKPTQTPANTNVNAGAPAPEVKDETPAPETGAEVKTETPAPETVTPPTLDELKANAKAAALHLLEVQEGEDEEAKKKALADMAKAQRLVTEHIAREKAIIAQAAIDEAKKARFALVDDMLTKADEARNAAESYRKGDITLEVCNAINDSFRAAVNFIKEELGKTVAGNVVVKPTLHVAQGMTGNQLKKEGGSVTAEIVALLEQGQNIDQIEAAGYLRKTISDVRWNWEKKKGLR